MTELFFVRHGQSKANLEHIFAGAYDSPLSELGEKQAEKNAEFFSENIKPDVVYASTLIRAYNTGNAVAKACGIPIIKNESLREIYAGKWEGLSFEKVASEYSKEFSVWMNDLGNAVCTDGESVAELQKRVFEAVINIAKENDGKKVVIATHATPIRVMECIFNKLPLTDVINIPWVTNASVTHVKYKDGEWEVVSRSYDDHLDGMTSSLPATV